MRHVNQCSIQITKTLVLFYKQRQTSDVGERSSKEFLYCGEITYASCKNALRQLQSKVASAQRLENLTISLKNTQIKIILHVKLNLLIYAYTILQKQIYLECTKHIVL